MQITRKFLAAFFLFLAVIVPSTAKADLPWFRFEKAGDSDKYLLMTTWGVANFSPGSVILEFSPAVLGEPGCVPVLLEREDVDDVSLLTFALRAADAPANSESKDEKLYTVIYHRLREKSLGCFERSDTSQWCVGDAEATITDVNSGKIKRITIAHPEERRSLVGFDGLLLGGFVRGEWVDARKVVENDEYGPGIVAFGVYGAEGIKGFGQGGELYQAYPAFDTPAFDITMVDSNGTELLPGSARLALTGPWNAAPRQAVPLNVKNSTYTNRLKEYLAQNGLPNATANIMQLFRVDIEGDGVDEVILCAQNIVATGSEGTSWEADKPLGTSIPDGSRKGDYSLILLYKVIDEEVHTIPLAQFIALKDSTPVNPPHVSPQLHKVYQFADLNGDGVMEIVMGENTYESFSYKVFAIKGDRAAQVLAVGAGS